MEQTTKATGSNDDAACTLLLTRDKARSEALARKFGPDVNVVISPVARTFFLDLNVKKHPDYFVFTSQVGVEAAIRSLGPERGLAFAVGKRTAQIAREAGFRATSARGTATDLVDLLASREPQGRGLWVRGENAALDLTIALAADLPGLTSEIAYRRELLALNAAATAAIQGEKPLLLPLFSPATARFVGQEFSRLGASAQFDLVAISDTCAAAWGGPEPAHIAIAKKPEADGMLAAIRERLAVNVAAK